MYIPIKLHKNQIPEFNDIWCAGIDKRGGFLRTTMTSKVNLSAGPTRTSFTHQPEILLQPIRQDFLRRNSAQNKAIKRGTHKFHTNDLDWLIRKPHSLHVSINKTWGRSAITPRRVKKCMQWARDYSDHRTCKITFKFLFCCINLFTVVSTRMCKSSMYHN